MVHMGYGGCQTNKMALGNQQQKILKHLKKLFSDKNFSPAKSYEKYKEETGYNSEKSTFNNILLKLHKKGLLDKPENGKYKVNTRGKQKIDYLENPEKYEDWTQTDVETRQELIEYFTEYKNQKFKAAEAANDPFKIRITELQEFDPEIVDQFENKPIKTHEIILEAAKEATELEEHPPIEYNFDVDYFETPIYKARSGSNAEKIITVQGTVESSSEIFNICHKIEFSCFECAKKIEKKQFGNKKKKPKKCKCGSENFRTVKEYYRDRIRFTVSREKEQNEKLKCVYETDEIESDAKETFQPGSKVRISGKLEVEERSKKKNRYGEPVLNVLGFRAQDQKKTLEDYSNDKIEEVKEKVEGRTNPFRDFATSLAPHIVEEDEMKKIFAAGLIGGASTRDDGRIHICILSNPGRGKSDLQEFVEETFPNSHYADGKQASGVGLTATVEQEKGGLWRLKAGKLVFADGGVLGIDEFDKMDGEDVERLNTAMQKPTFPVDKAGVNARLPGCATIIATGNFKRYLDDDDDEIDFIKEYIPDHADSLMDRFSLIFALTGDNDSGDVEDAILKGFSKEEDPDIDPFFNSDELVIFRELTQRYEPELTQVSREFLKDWLNAQKDIGGSGFEKDSKRYLVSLGKLTTMFARCRLSNRTNERDAERAIKLIKMCRESRGLKDGESDINELKKDNDVRKVRLIEEKALEELDRRDEEIAVTDLESKVPFSSEEFNRLIDEYEFENLYFTKSDKISKIN